MENRSHIRDISDTFSLIQVSSKRYLMFWFWNWTEAFTQVSQPTAVKPLVYVEKFQACQKIKTKRARNAPLVQNDRNFGAVKIFCPCTWELEEHLRVGTLQNQCNKTFLFIKWFCKTLDSAMYSHVEPGTARYSHVQYWKDQLCAIFSKSKCFEEIWQLMAT